MMNPLVKSDVFSTMTCRFILRMLTYLIKSSDNYKNHLVMKATVPRISVYSLAGILHMAL